jgi:protease I
VAHRLLKRESIMGKAILVVAPRDFRDEELFDTKAELERAGHACVIASRSIGKCTGMRGGSVRAEIAIDDVDVADCDAIVFIGGSGARVFFRDAHATSLARGAFDAGKVVAAICVAPTILATAGILHEKRATAFHSDISELRYGGARYVGPGVTVDGRVITASGPDQSVAFGKAIARALRPSEQPSIHPTA